MRKEAIDLSEAREHIGPDDIVLLHLSIGSVANTLFPELDCRKAILYHNITPPEYLEGIQQQIANNLAKGREQVRALAGVADVVMADSAFNAGELKEMGYGDPEVLPLILDLDQLRAKAHRGTVKKYSDGMSNVLFVGRCVPNKRLEDLLSCFYYYQHFVEPASRFIHAGSYAGTEQYHALLLTRCRDLELQQIQLLGSVHQDELNACYRVADMFLCMSEHEGFCIPLIESMVHDVPVIAFDAGAVAETLDGAGILVREKRFDLIAEMMGRVQQDKTFREAVINGQRQRLKRYTDRDLQAELRDHLAPLL
jgi:glycosyltransferase involved in cell wall biosynthesis